MAGHAFFMDINMPCVSIGLPVFNGENYLEEALQAILRQTFTDFELIICDNASTDRTQAICETYAHRDSRIRYYRNPVNIGAAPNFNRTVTLAKGIYFKWAAHDDLLMPNFLEQCVAVLDADPTVVLCHAKVKEIDAQGNLIKYHEIELPHVTSLLAHKRFADLVLVEHPCHDVFGLIRLAVLRQTALIASYIGSDRVLLAELGLHGRFHKVPDYLFISRSHRSQSVLALPLHRRRHWFDTTLKDGRSLPHWRYWYEYAHCVQRVTLPKAEKNACYYQLIRYPNWAAIQLIKDLVIALNPTYVEAIKEQNPPWLCRFRQFEKGLFNLVHHSYKKAVEEYSKCESNEQLNPAIDETTPLLPPPSPRYTH